MPNINDKNATSGELKFSIISLSDITDAQTVLTIVFDAKASCTDYTTEFELNGSGLADSLTNAILLNFVESPVTVVSTGHDFSIDKHDADNHWQKCSRCDEIDGKEAHNGGTATCTAQKVCTDCGAFYGDILAHDYANGEWKSDASGHWKKCADCTAEDTANKVGHNATDDNNCATVVYCTDCNYMTVVAKTHTLVVGASKNGTHHIMECANSGCDHTEDAAHSFNQKVESADYLKNNADCTTAKTYYYSCVCGHKGSTTFTVGSELGHNFEWVVDTPADKQNAGVKHEECTVCHTKRNEGTVIDKLTCGHATATKTNQVDADHHNTGKKAYWYCAECNKYFSDEAYLLEIADIGAYGIIAKVDHEFATNWKKDANDHWHECTCGDKTDVTAHIYNLEVVNTDYLKDGATCTTEAVYYKSCVCGAIGTETFTNGEALGHTESDAVVENRVEPNCTTAGSYDSVIYCSVCEAELSREQKPIEALGHDLEHHEAKAPTCTEIGWNAYDTCKREGCGYTTYAELEALGHTESDAVVENRVEPNCTTAGSYDSVIYCSVCEAELNRNPKSIETLGHDLNHHDTKTPTCTEIGWNAYNACKRDGCEHTTYVELEALGHDFTMDKQDADYHWQKCSRCDEIDGKAEHTYGDDNVCDTCGYEKSVQSETETSRETEKPADTDKPTDTDKPSDDEKKDGCGSSISGGMVLIFTIIICGSMIGFKRRKSH